MLPRRRDLLFAFCNAWIVTVFGSALSDPRQCGFYSIGASCGDEAASDLMVRRPCSRSFSGGAEDGDGARRSARGRALNREGPLGGRDRDTQAAPLPRRTWSGAPWVGQFEPEMETRFLSARNAYVRQDPRRQRLAGARRPGA